MAAFQEAAAGIYRLCREHGLDNSFSVQEITDAARLTSPRLTRLAVGSALARRLPDVEGHLRRIAARSLRLSREKRDGLVWVRVAKVDRSGEGGA